MNQKLKHLAALKRIRLSEDRLKEPDLYFGFDRVHERTVTVDYGELEARVIALVGIPDQRLTEFTRYPVRSYIYEAARRVAQESGCALVMQEPNIRSWVPVPRAAFEIGQQIAARAARLHEQALTRISLA